MHRAKADRAAHDLRRLDAGKPMVVGSGSGRRADWLL
jgi:hypothetical protein